MLSGLLMTWNVPAALPMRTPVAADVPKFKVAALSTVKLPLLVLQVAAAFEVRVKAWVAALGRLRYRRRGILSHWR